MRNNRGSVSVFFAVVLVTLIVFTMSVVEVTRYQIMQLQAQQILISATQSVLAGYDSALKNEYGLFVRDPGYSDCDFVVPGNRELTGEGYTKDLRYYVEENLETTSLELLQVETAGHTLSSAEGRDYAKRDMVDYMSLRLPLIGFEHVAEMYGAAEKLGKTTKFIGEKNDLIREADRMDRMMADLYLSIDGIVVERSNQACEMKDVNFINRLFVADASNLEHIPGTIKRQQPIDAAHTLTSAMTAYEAIQEQIQGIGPVYFEFDQIYEGLQVLYDKCSDLQEAMDDLEERLEDVNDDIDDERDDLRDGKGSSSRLSRLKSKRRSMNRQMRELRRDEGALETLISDDEEHFEQLKTGLKVRLTAIEANQEKVDQALDTVKRTVVGEDSVLGCVQTSLNTVTQLQAKAASLNSDIHQFLAESEQASGDYMTSAYENSVEELEAIQSGYGAGGEDYYETANNLLLIRQLLEEDERCLLSVRESGQKVAANYNYVLANQLTEEGMDQASMERLVKLTGSSVNFHKAHLYYGTWSKTYVEDKVLEWLYTFDVGIKVFKQIPYMNYEQYEAVTGRDGTDMLTLYHQLKDLSERYRMAMVFAGLDLESSKPLPDGLYSDGLMLADLELSEGDEEDGSYKAMGNRMALLTETAGNIKDQLLMNEYAVGMFRSYPDRYRDNPETLAGYSKLDHPFAAELAYIHTGEKRAEKALQKVAGQIIAVRIGANLVHLASDGAKRATVSKMAQQLSGWWAGPVVSVLATLLICLAWATLESFVDLEKLIKGEKVPFIKTSCTWYTDLNGLEKLLTEGLSEFAVNAVTNGIDYASETVQSKSKALIMGLGDDTQAVVEDALDQMFKRSEQLKGMAVETLDRQVVHGLDAVLDSYRGERAVNSGDHGLTVGSPGYDLASAMTRDLDSRLSVIEAPSYMDLVLVKQSVLEDYESELTVVRKAVEKKIDQVVDEKVQESILVIEATIEQVGEEGKDRLKTAIEESVRLEEEKQLEAILDAGQLENVPESELKTVLMPEIDYEMYIRLFMLLDNKGSEVRLIRMLDLMDYNLAVGRAGSVAGFKQEQLVLGDYLVAVEGEMEVRLPYLFLDLDLERMKKKGVKGYLIRSEVVNHYD